MNRQKFRAALNALMRREMLTPSTLADRLGVSRQAVYLWLWSNAAHSSVQRETVYKVCRVFDLSVEEFEALAG